MSIEPESIDLRLSLEIDRGAIGTQRISVRVEGHGALAAQAAARILDVFERASADALGASTAQPLLTAAEVVRPVAESAAPAEPVASQVSDAVAESVAGPAPVERTAPMEQSTQPRPIPWFRRARARIAGGIGVVLFGLAVLVPLLVPPEMRREILPMPIAFGLVGALSLFSAILPEPAPKSAGAVSAARVVDPAAEKRRRASVGSGAPASASRRVAGIGFGVLFVVGGLVAPFVLAGSSADDRFLMMLGFAPIAAIGTFLIWIFTRKPAAAPALAVRRSDTTSMPALQMTSALTALAVMLAIVVLLVILATVMQAL
jgi:hypothetical protein